MDLFYQDYDLIFVCFNDENWIGNGKLIPSGPLREKLDSLKKYDAVLIKGKTKKTRMYVNQLKKYNEYTGFSLSRASWEQIVEFEKNKFLFNSIKIIESKKRYYPHKNLSQIIGYMGKSSDAKELYSKGIFHIEKTYDDHLKGKPAVFKTEVLDVLKPKLPEMNEEFFTMAGIPSKDEAEFKKTLKERLSDDLDSALTGMKKERIFDALAEMNEFEIPESMIMNEMINLRKGSAAQMGKEYEKLKDEEFPIENFRENAQKRVKLGIILNKLIEENELKADADRVKKLIEERSKNYKEPEKVVNWYYSNEEQLKNIESLALEEQVTELLEKEGKSTDESMDFDKVLGINV